MPNSPSIRSLAFSGNKIFAAASSDGVYMSTNNGSNWLAVNSGLLGQQLFSFALSSTNIFVGSLYGGIFTCSLSQLTGIEELHNNTIVSIAPNPFTSSTTISFSQEQTNTTIIISDILGKEIKALNFTGKQCTLEKGTMESGVYFVTITDEKKNFVNKKVVVE